MVPRVQLDCDLPRALILCAALSVDHPDLHAASARRSDAAGELNRRTGQEEDRLVDLFELIASTEGLEYSPTLWLALRSSSPSASRMSDKPATARLGAPSIGFFTCGLNHESSTRRPGDTGGNLGALACVAPVLNCFKTRRRMCRRV